LVCGRRSAVRRAVQRGRRAGRNVRHAV